jgi:hypothetical protein
VLSGKKGTKEYDEWFLRYKPAEQKDARKSTSNNKKTQKGEKRSRKSMKNKTRKKKGLLGIFK